MVDSEVRTADGAGSADAAQTADPSVQAALGIELVDTMSKVTASVANVLSMVHGRLHDYAGLHAATVFTLDDEDGSLHPVGEVGGAVDEHARLAGSIFRTPAGGPPVRSGQNLTMRLRFSGETVGVLVLTGDRLDRLLPGTLAAVALGLASTVRSLAAERTRQFVAHTTATIRKLYEHGTIATTVEAAGELLARTTAEAFRTEHAAVQLVDPDGRVCHVTGVSLSNERNIALREKTLGRMAADSPVWRAAAKAAGPLLVDDIGSSPVRPGGIVQTIGLRTYVAIPLMSATGPVGMVICGDAGTARRWTHNDRVLAEQLGAEGAMIVDSARLRQAEVQHVEELTKRAYHDALTGLANRSQLMITATRTVTAANRAGRRTALLLLDLDGFKGVNDAVGHHAGDFLLQQVAERLLESVRENDLVARLGGDEFAILLTRDPDETAASAVADRIHRRLCEPYDLDGTTLTIGASIGVALCPDDADDVPTLMRGADEAMYRAKRHGGGCRLFISSE
jgi:diguanylate cyclase (GGDEF)-like protein